MAIGKILIGTGATTALGLGITNVGLYLEIESLNLMPYWKPLSEDADFSTYKTKVKVRQASSSGGSKVEQERGYENNYGGIYKKYLVGVSNSYNDHWWSWSGRNRFELIADAEITPGYPGSKSPKKMKEGCQKAYTAKTDEVKLDAWKENEYKEDLIWFLCSPGGSKPKSISQVDKEKYKNTSDSFGQNNEYNKKLIDVDDSTNDWFWEIQNNEYTKNKDSLSDNNVRDWCKKAYSQTKADSGEYTEENVFKWCSLEGSK